MEGDDGERPQVIEDIICYLTGKPQLQSNLHQQKIREEDEFKLAKIIIPTIQTHDELSTLKYREMILLANWDAITGAFTKLWGESEKD